MFRRSALSAAASLAVVLLAVTGCKIQVSNAAPGGASTADPVQAATSGVTRSGSLIVEPGAGFSPVYSLINGARHSIDMTMYEFSDTTAEHDLAAAAQRGVQVRVILDRRARSVNSGAYSYLRSHRVAVTWSSPKYRYTHQKTVIIDGTKAVIMTANLTSRYYTTSRDFLVTDTERADVSAITAVFNADFKGKAVRPGDGSDLVWSPTDSQDHLLGLINGATSSLRIYSEEMGDRTVENALIKAAKRGVRVRVILDRRARSVNSRANSYFRSHGVAVTWSSSDYRYTHQKTVIIDGTKAVIMTANLTSRYYATSRDFLVTDTERADISAITAVFNADFAKKTVHPGDGNDLVWSPTDSQDQLIALINGATSSLRIYSEEMGDTTVENALIKAAKRGVDVQVCGENEDGEYDSAYTKLARAGIHISYYSSSTGFYIHGKVIEADYGTGHARMFVGSENFSRTSLDDNRELGLIISDPAVLSAMARTFAADFGSGHHWS